MRFFDNFEVFEKKEKLFNSTAENVSNLSTIYMSLLNANNAKRGYNAGKIKTGTTWKRNQGV